MDEAYEEPQFGPDHSMLMKHQESHYMKEQHYLGWLPHCLSLIVVAPMELEMLSLMKCYIY
jgi:hypothetical protein